MKRPCAEKDAEREVRDAAKREDMEKEKTAKNSEIGFNL